MEQEIGRGDAESAERQLNAVENIPILVTSSVNVQVTQNPNTRAYTYNYSVTNAVGSVQEIDFLVIDIGGDFVDIQSSSSPQGWGFGLHADRPFASWGVVEGEVPPDYVDDGNLVPSSAPNIAALYEQHQFSEAARIIMELTDQALYQAKQQGRNRIVAWAEPEAFE